MTVATVARTRAELAAARATLPGTVALVPTMGALHEGHRALLRRAGQVADATVVSIFVNPLQFAPTEDLDRYPRTFDADLAMCADEGVQLVFAPARAQMYPREPLVRIAAGPIGHRFEGASRPGHFDGVLTVVAKLFALVHPDIAVFGGKDAQQVALVRRMVADLDLPVRIEAVPIIRDDDGLALSSRNAYLSVPQRQAALALPRALRAAEDAQVNGASLADIVEAARAVLVEADAVTIDYVDLVDPESFASLNPESFASLNPAAGNAGGPAEALLVIAARVGSTRLIDNTVMTLQPSATPTANGART
ncbi:MAG TPA: pantoate--beta-alanine ligase [Acidothermaceae bacterium]